MPLVVQDQFKAYWTVIGLDIAFGCAYALLQAALYGTAGPAPALTANLMVGLGVSGLGINIIRMILLASVKNQQESAQIFFYFSGAILVLCTIFAYIFSSDFDKFTLE